MKYHPNSGQNHLSNLWTDREKAGRAIAFGLLLFLLCLTSDGVSAATMQKKAATDKPRAAKKDKAKADAAHDDHDHDHSAPATKKSASTKSSSAPGAYDPTKPSGIFKKISKPLAKLLKFERKAEMLSFDVPTSYSDADGAFREIRSQGRGGGGGHGSGTFWTQYVSSQQFAGRVQRSEQNFGGNRKRRPDALTAEFIEAGDDMVSLEVQAENKTDFVIRVNGGLKPYYLQVIQGKDSFSVQEVNGNEAFSAKASSFEAFCRENPNFVQDRLLLALRNHGISSPITRFNSVTRDHVLALLSPADDDQLQQFRQTFSGLESADYEQREEASKKLEADFEKWKKVVKYAAGSDQFSLEVRSRLQKLIKAKSSENDRQLIALVAAGDLPNDTEYLVWLLSQTEDAQKRSFVTNQLKKLTQKDFGNDQQSWQKFVAQKTSSDAATATNSNTGDDPGTPKLAEVEGYLPQMAVPTANLLQLKIDNNKVGLDRDHWSAQFNGESIEDLVNRLRTQLEKSNLPKRWLNPGGGKPLQYVFHEHVLFEHIESAIPRNRTPNYYSYGNLSSYQNNNINRKVEQPHLMMILDRERQTSNEKTGRLNNAKNKPNVFRFSARERRDSKLELSFVENEDGSLHLTIASQQAQSVLQFAQTAQGKVFCHMLTGDVSQSVSAENITELYQKHRDFLEATIYPVFSRFGIQIPDTIGGPLTIENAPEPAKKTNSATAATRK